MDKIDVHKCTASQRFLEIVWDIFFLQKKRGVDLTQHFPWFFDKTANFLTFEAIVDGHTAGGLVVLEKIINDIKIGLVGLVCVDARYRGNGLLRKLMSKMEQVCIREQYSGLVLWTSQHSLYSPHGFMVSDDSVIVKINVKNKGKETPNPNLIFKINECFDLALPPFAEKMYRYSDIGIYILYCEKNEEKYIIDFHGEIENVIKEFASNVSHKFILNAFNTEVNEILSAKNLADIEIIHQNIKMIKALDNTKTQSLKELRFLINERI